MFFVVIGFVEEEIPKRNIFTQFVHFRGCMHACNCWEIVEREGGNLLKPNQSLRSDREHAALVRRYVRVRRQSCVFLTPWLLTMTKKPPEKIF